MGSGGRAVRWQLVLAQMDVVPGDPGANLAHLRRLLRVLPEGTDIVVLPELWTTGPAGDDLDRLADPGGRGLAGTVGPLALDRGVHIIAGSVVVQRPGGLTNTACVFDRGGALVAQYDKVHLFPPMGEDRRFQPGRRPGHFILDSVPCGVMICYDLRFPELARSLALAGARVFFVPAHWPLARLDHWRTLLRARAIENQVYVVGVNAAGSRGGEVFGGHSLVVDPWGRVLAEAGEEAETLVAAIDLGLVDEVRKAIPVFSGRRPAAYARLLTDS